MGHSAAKRLSRSQWTALERAHRERVEPWVRPRLERRKTGAKHPVDDFLFEYYSYRPAQLSRWHPGAAIALEPPVEHLAEVLGFSHTSDGVEVDPSAVTRQAALLPAVDRLLAATQGRRPRIGCSALHEWAMVYRAPQSQVRHAAWSLRLPSEEIAEVVEHVGLRCTHFDAYRFFTADAAPRNAALLTRATQEDFEQPGCLHATMDLYKWAYRLSPLIGADLIADAFEVARAGRHLDMRAAPYDLSDLGVEPLLMESAAGRAEFAVLQRDLAARGQELRQHLRSHIAGARDWLGSR